MWRLRLELALVERLLQSDFRRILVLGSLQAIVNELRLVPMSDLILDVLAVQEASDVGLGCSSMPLQIAATIDEENVTVEKLSPNDGRNLAVHVGDQPVPWCEAEDSRGEDGGGWKGAG